MGRASGYILTVLSVCLLLSVAAEAQVYDSVYLAKVRDSVERYYRLHPRQKMDREERAFRVQPLYGVMFTEETRFTAMGGFMGMYRSSADSLVPLSSVGAVAMLSTNLSGGGAVTGQWYAPGGRFTVVYSARFINSPRRFWGLGFESASDDSNQGHLTSRKVRVRSDFLYRKGRMLLAGGFAGYDFYHAAEISGHAGIGNTPVRTHYVTAGARLDLDTRDSVQAPSRGVFLNVEQSVNIPLYGSGGVFSRTEVTADFYFPMWEGGVLALDIYGNISSSGAPWTVWPDAGGDVRLRGYYQGRYRDRNLLAAQVELRQRVYRAHGVALWGGAGYVFPSFREFDIKNTLPTYGAGYRLSVMGIVLRLDVGFGLRGQYAVIAGVSHSF